MNAQEQTPGLAWLGLQVSERSRSPGLAGVLEINDINKKIVADNTTVVEYFLGERRSFMWFLSEDSVAVYSLPGRKTIESLAAQTYKVFAEKGKIGGELKDKALSELGRILLDPWIGECEGSKRLVIVADGALTYVPFAALPCGEPDASGRRNPIVATREVVYAPSISFLLNRDLRGKGKGRVPRGSIALFGDPVYSEDDPRFPRMEARITSAEPSFGPRLPWTQNEVAAIASLVPADRRFVAEGFAANLSAVNVEKLESYRVIHFATHAFFDAERPDQSGLVLSAFDSSGNRRPAILSLRDIRKLKLPVELVVLSGSRTAAGRGVRGEGPMSLTRGFLNAGASQVVGTLWSVDDRATAEFMAEFYRAMLSKGLPPSAALRVAQLTALRKQGTSAPFYWAAFTIEGDWR